MEPLTPISSSAAREILKRIDFFDAFSASEKDKVISFHSRFFSFNAGEVLIQEGQNCKSLFILLSGETSVYKWAGKKALAKLLPGDIFGEISFVTQMPRITSVRADETSIVLEIDHQMLDALGAEIREKIKDQIILKLISRLDSMNMRHYDEP